MNDQERKKVPLASEATAVAESIGLRGDAAALFVAAGAPARHAARRGAAAEAAAEWATAASPGLAACSDPAYERTRMAAAALVADMVGVGGHGGLSGDATARHPAFRMCGTGRKHAQDGAAWTAAIAAAADIVFGRLVATVGHDTALLDAGDFEQSPALWRRAVAGNAIREAAAMRGIGSGMLAEARQYLDLSDAALPGWGALYNEATAFVLRAGESNTADMTAEERAAIAAAPNDREQEAALAAAEARVRDDRAAATERYAECFGVDVVAHA